MNKKEKFLSMVSGSETLWIEQNKYDLAHVEELDANVRIALRLRKYLKEKDLTQVQLADKLNVTPQYINKLLRAKEINIGVGTAIRYGNILGIKLVDVCPDSNLMPFKVVLKSNIKPEYDRSAIHALPERLYKCVEECSVDYSCLQENNSVYGF